MHRCCPQLHAITNTLLNLYFYLWLGIQKSGLYIEGRYVIDPFSGGRVLEWAHLNLIVTAPQCLSEPLNRQPASVNGLHFQYTIGRH